MNDVLLKRGFLIGLILIFVAIITVPMGVYDSALAQDSNPIAVTGTSTEPPIENTATPTTPATAIGPQPPATPTSIPEPVTVILFGSGLAALSASVARKRRQK
ncbi:MAG: PEP-CTERM sorting domain-containing protein [Chloroflexota bacterium]